MTGLSASTPALGWHPSDFALEGTDGRRYRLADVRGAKGTLVMFICNHCPYVQAVLDDIIRDVRELKEHGIGAIGIMPNDVAAYPADSLENMKRLAEAKQLPLPYAIDSTQEVARAFGAACTPDFFGFNADLELQYRGRIYAVRNLQRVPGSGRELLDAMVQISKTSRGPAQRMRAWDARSNGGTSHCIAGNHQTPFLAQRHSDDACIALPKVSAVARRSRSESRRLSQETVGALAPQRRVSTAPLWGRLREVAQGDREPNPDDALIEEPMHMEDIRRRH